MACNSVIWFLEGFFGLVTYVINILKLSLKWRMAHTGTGMPPHYAETFVLILVFTEMNTMYQTATISFWVRIP